MENLTQDQAEIIFSLFLAQNANRKISEFDNNYDGSLKICELVLERDVYGPFLCTDTWIYFGFSHQKFHVWVFRSDEFDGTWKPFDIMKYISFEDKV